MALAERAAAIAYQAHAGQVDKAGLEYITHPQRVASRVSTDTERAVAWLHDVVEDTGVTLDDLRVHFDSDIVSAVDALTHRPHEPRVDYYSRVAVNPLARTVKLADIADNTDPVRLADLDAATRARLTEKYAKALRCLTVQS